MSKFALCTFSYCSASAFYHLSPATASPLWTPHPFSLHSTSRSHHLGETEHAQWTWCFTLENPSVIFFIFPGSGYTLCSFSWAVGPERHLHDLQYWCCDGRGSHPATLFPSTMHTQLQWNSSTGISSPVEYMVTHLLALFLSP